MGIRPRRFRRRTSRLDPLAFETVPGFGEEPAVILDLRHAGLPLLLHPLRLEDETSLSLFERRDRLAEFEFAGRGAGGKGIAPIEGEGFDPIKLLVNKGPESLQSLVEERRSARGASPVGRGGRSAVRGWGRFAIHRGNAVPLAPPSARLVRSGRVEVGRPAAGPLRLPRSPVLRPEPGESRRERSLSAFLGFLLVDLLEVEPKDPDPLVGPIWASPGSWPWPQGHGGQDLRLLAFERLTRQLTCAVGHHRLVLVPLAFAIVGDP